MLRENDWDKERCSTCDESWRYIGHGIKENTELAEHEAGVDNVKKGASSVFNKMRNVITVFHNRLFPGSIIFIHELDFKRF